MDGFTLMLVIVGVLALVEALSGLFMRSKGMFWIGFILALICALAFAIVYFYGDSIYIRGAGYKL